MIKSQAFAQNYKGIIVIGIFAETDASKKSKTSKF